MTIAEEIVRAESFVSDPPPNESSTCEWVILPMLWAMGYDRREILPRVLDSNGQFPDYSLLSGTEHSWFIEAKAWTTALADSHAQQSLNYANSNGRRWVVLTNGHVWRLYDNDIRGYAAHKLVLETKLSEPDRLKAFLAALSKDSVVNGGIESFVKRTCLAAQLSMQLHDATSDIVRAITNILVMRPGLNNISGVDITSYFSEDSDTMSHAASTLSSIETTDATNIDESAVGLNSLLASASTYVTGKRPRSVSFPDGSVLLIRTWADLAQEVIRFLMVCHQLPDVPFCGRTRGGSYFLNTSPQHQDRPMRACRRVENAGREIYIDTNRSGVDLIRSVCDVCALVGIDAGAIHVSSQQA